MSEFKPRPAHGRTNLDEQEDFEQPPYLISLQTLLVYGLFTIIGHMRDLLPSFGIKKKAAEIRLERRAMQSFAPLFADFESFFARNIYVRLRICFNKPISGCPGGHVMLMERYTPDHGETFLLTGRSRRVLNLASYNYLGFAETKGLCADSVKECIEECGYATCSPSLRLGTHQLHRDLETLVARFVRKPAAVIVGMGFATNSTTIPLLAGKGDLVISDQLNHASLVLGVRLSGAKVMVFQHNDMKDLERILRRAHAEGQPRTHRPWRKIIIIVEGIYSMEGGMTHLRDVVRLKKKYKAYLYLDEAHSIGALGESGRGIAEHTGVDPMDIDIMMGTFTKSFGACGGYIASTPEVIAYIRRRQHAAAYAASMSLPVTMQTITSMKIIAGELGGNEGRVRIQQLAENSRFFRQGLKNMGFIVYGNDNSPVVPMLIFNPGLLYAFGKEMETAGIAAVVVGFPATPLIDSRARFCVSASHTRADLEHALRVIDFLGGFLGLKNSNRPPVKSPTIRVDKRVGGNATKQLEGGETASGSSSSAEATKGKKKTKKEKEKEKEKVEETVEEEPVATKRKRKPKKY